MKKLLLSLLAIAIQFQLQAQTDSTVVTKAPEPRPDLDTVFQVAYSTECKLATSKSSKKWCTEVTIYRILVENYPYPEIKDSTTFENREIYTLTFTVGANGMIMNSKLEGSSNPTVQQAILETLKSSNIPFYPAEKTKGNRISYKYMMKLRAFDFMSPQKGPNYLPQEPMEINDQDLDGVEKGSFIGGYRISE